jgi:hypothetical protein
MKNFFMPAYLLAALGLLLMMVPARAQNTPAGTRGRDSSGVRALTMTEYERAKTLSVGDPDKDSYVKFENTYILDRNDFGKPYFITGDDGLKKRIDLYKLILKEGRVELGTVIFYTTEKGRRYSACLPGFKAGAKIWEKYFEDIHAIDKEEKNFVLKLSYVLSRELGFQQYYAAAATQGKDVSKERESGTYGNDICFPGDMQVSLADGTMKPLSQIKPGDEILTVDPHTLAASRVRVRELKAHAVRNYAITKLLLLSVEDRNTDAGAGSGTSLDAPGGHNILLHAKWIQATPNHPMPTPTGAIKAGELQEGDQLYCRDEPGDINPRGYDRVNQSGYSTYTVWYKTEIAGGMQRVYNIVAGGGTTLVLNGVVVSQK